MLASTDLSVGRLAYPPITVGEDVTFCRLVFWISRRRACTDFDRWLEFGRQRGNSPVDHTVSIPCTCCYSYDCVLYTTKKQKRKNRDLMRVDPSCILAADDRLSYNNICIVVDDYSYCVPSCMGLRSRPHWETLAVSLAILEKGAGDIPEFPLTSRILEIPVSPFFYATVH